MKRLLVLVALLALAATPALAQSKDIVDTAVAAGSFKTLAKLLTDADLVGVMKGAGPYTVFAPTDDAFLALNLTPDNVGDLPQSALTEILLYHVLPGRRDSNEVLASTQLRTLQGAFLQQASGSLTDVLGRQANIIVLDVPASNGIIHAIDAVVLPFAP